MKRLFIIVLPWLALFPASCASRHPALLPPDGQSHRGDRMIGDTLNKDEVLKLGKLYQYATGFEERQEYFLRLLDYFWFSERRFIGMTRADIEKVFGSAQFNPAQDNNPKPSRLEWAGGRDRILITFNGDIAANAYYVTGF